MTSSGATASREEDSTVAAYETLRSEVVEGTPSGSHLGLIVLLREGLAGLATWMCHAECSARAQPAIRSHRLMPLLGDQDQASIVRVLASMALAGREQMSA